MRNTKLKSSKLLLMAGLLTATVASAASSQKDVNTASGVDRVLAELTRQHNNASNIVKSGRQPVNLLAFDSPLLATNTPATNNQQNMLQRLTAVAASAVNNFSQSGIATWYGESFHGSNTASGEKFDMYAMTAAHPSLPINSMVKVTNEATGKSVVVKINDRHETSNNSILDLSYGAAKQLGLVNSGLGKVIIERIANK